MALKNWSTTAISNSSVDSINFAENQAPSTVNDSARALMVDVRSWYEDAEWRDWGHAVTYASASSFTVSGDKTSTYVPGRPIRCADSSTLYGKVSSSSYGAPDTTVNVTLDSGNLSASLTAVALGQDPTGDPIDVSGVRGAAGTAITNTFTGSNTFQSSDAGAAAGPTPTLDRASASPAASDVLGAIPFTGRDDGAGTDTYAQIQAEIVDPAAGSEDGKFSIQTAVAGTLATRAYVAQGAVIGSPTGGDQGAGTVNATAIYDDGVQVLPTISGTVQASTSGTSIDFTGIPSWATNIVVELAGVSTNGTSDMTIRLGDSGGIETSGYLGGYSAVGNGVATGAYNSTDGFTWSVSAASVWHGALHLSRIDESAFHWVANGNFSRSDTTSHVFIAGSKALSAALDRVSVTTVGGVNTFDAGKINIKYW